MTQYKEYHAVYTNGSVTTKMLRETKISKLKQVITNFKHSDHITHIDDFIKELEEVLDEHN